ncbi:hypothetical protein NXW27_26995 [Phocaeicola dorei]|nr:hypothetical protein [Phocaeicola dorei]
MRSSIGPTYSSKIQIRGSNSITGLNQPLIIVDGVPSDNFTEPTTMICGIHLLIWVTVYRISTPKILNQCLFERCIYRCALWFAQVMVLS